MKKRIMIAVFIMLFLVGMIITFYPEISDFINRRNQSFVIEEYGKYVSQMPIEEKDSELEKAHAYNLRLFDIGDIRRAKAKYAGGALKEYNSILNLHDDGVIGVLKIPKINVELAIYHGTEGPNLSVGIGHMEYTSFPTGELNTHTALCGHTALSTARLLTDLDQLKKGDEFFITIMGTKLKYVVDDIRIVEPNNFELLNIVEGKSYVTLITCTPPGVGTERLLVRGERVIE